MAARLKAGLTEHVDGWTSLYPFTRSRALALMEFWNRNHLVYSSRGNGSGRGSFVPGDGNVYFSVYALRSRARKSFGGRTPSAIACETRLSFPKGRKR